MFPFSKYICSPAAGREKVPVSTGASGWLFVQYARSSVDVPTHSRSPRGEAASAFTPGSDGTASFAG